MNLIFYRGLNCHLACVVNIAAELGVDYQNAFATLWSETDFADDSNFHVYSSKRVFPNLEALGMTMESLHCRSNHESEAGFSLIPEGEFFLVGMDTFHIPWSLLFHAFHEPHYFFARKEELDTVACFDPTYQQDDLRFPFDEIAPHAFDLSRVRKRPVPAPQPDMGREARDILEKHPEMQEKFLAEMIQYRNATQKNITPLVKQLNAMINNRYLFERFLLHHPSTLDYAHRFFSEQFFLRWEAVKNGVYKAYIMRNNSDVIDEVCDLFLELMREETDMAREIVLAE